MKARILVVATLLSLPVALAAQSSGPTSKGNALVGGSASFSRTTRSIENVDNDESTTYVEFTPNILYFFAPRLGIGGLLGYGRASGGGSTSSGTTLGPEIRYFLADPAAKAQPYIGANVVRQWAKFDTNVGVAKPQSTRYGATAGVIWMVSRQVGISSEAYYQRSSEDNLPANSLDITTNGFGLRFGFAAFLTR